MWMRTSISIAALAGLLALAAGSAPDALGRLRGGGVAGNRAACVQYVEALSALPCMAGSSLDVAQFCPEEMDLSAVDMREYYACLAKSSACAGEAPDLSQARLCKLPPVP